MFSQTEELMKFQFMSMSLSYFSSLNMLKQLRDMNADTTSAAISTSADAAASSAAAAGSNTMIFVDLPLLNALIIYITYISSSCCQFTICEAVRIRCE